MKGRIKKLLLTLLIAMAVVFIGVTPVKSEAARKLPVGGLVQKPMPKNLGVEKMADDDIFAIKTTPRKARFTTGRHYQYLTDEEKFLYEAFYCAALDGNYVPYAKHDKTEEYENYAVVIHTGKESYLEKFQNDAAISYALMKAQFAAACDHPDRVELDMVGLYGFGGKVDNGTYTTYMILVAEADDSKFEQYDAAIKQNVETIVNEIKTNRGATSPWDAVNEKIAYDYYCGEYNLEYDEANMEKSYNYCHTAYGSLVLHKAVCDGYSKGFALIMEKLGVPTMVNDGIAYFTNGGGGGHAWNMVQLEGTWYICCTTYGQSDMTDSLGRIVPDYSMLLAGKHTPYEWYPAQKHPDVEAQLSEEPFDCYGAMGKRDQLSLKIENVEELKELITKAEQCGKEEYKIGFQFTGEDAEQFEAEMTGLLEAYPGANAVRIKSEGDPAYQIFRLAES